MGNLPSVDSNVWGPVEWTIGALTTAVTAVSGFVWGTRAKLTDHDRRLELLESGVAADLRRLEEKIDSHHSEMTRMLVSIATRERTGA